MTCEDCHRPTKGPRLPHKWKRVGEAIYCPRCVGHRYVLRTIAVPVVEPIGTTWPEGRTT